MVAWYVDEGLQTLINEWKRAHPGAVVGTIGDSHHSTNPNVTQHAPDRGGFKPGDDKGEVDGADFMPGNGVTAADLDDLFAGLRESHDKRILNVIHRKSIFSSVVSPWNLRDYSGEYHEHVHVSVNDDFDNNKSDWAWEKLVARTIQYVPVDGAKLPLLQLADEDAATPGWNHVARAQALANWMDSTTAPVATDGVYGKLSAQKFAKIFGGDGKKLPLAHIRKLHGI